MGGENSQLRGAKPASPHTNRKGGYNSGEHLVVCDRSGLIYDSSNVRKEWTGLIVGADQWEPRHPQEFRRGIREDIAVKEARPGAPRQLDLGVDLDDVTAVSGAVMGGVYTSGAATNARPFVYWTLDLGQSFDLLRAELSGLAISDAGAPPIRQGVALGWSADDVTYTNIEPFVGAFGDGVSGAPEFYAVDMALTARYLRLALIGGKGLGFAGVLTQTGLRVIRSV